MTKSVLEKIADEVVERLENISIANGYAFDAVVEVVGRDTNAFDPLPGKIIVVQSDEVHNEANSYPGNPAAFAYDIQFEIWGYAGKLDIKDETAVCVKTYSDYEIIAAIKKSLANNATSWHTFDNNSFNASLASSRPFYAPGGSGGMVVLEVQYRVSEIDPYTRR